MDAQLLSRRRTAAALAVAGALIAGAAAGLVGTGVRAYVIETPSMGAAAPVGSLVVAQPAAVGSLAVGDVVAFRPPEAAARVHVHRVVGSQAPGLRTRGDLNAAADPWPLTAGTLVGRVGLVLPGAGWALRASPLLLAAVLLHARGTRLLPRRLRGPARLVLWSSALVAVSALVGPWTGAEPLPGSSEHAVRVVSTGLLPQRVQVVAARGTGVAVVGSLDLRYGQSGSIELPAAADGAALALRVRPGLLGAAG